MRSATPFNPLEFLRLAREMGAASSEAELRAAVGRAYYALFLVTREKLKVTGNRNIHARVVEKLRNHPGFRSTGDQLDRLKRLRVAADYQMLPTKAESRDWTRNWRHADQLALVILNRLQKL
jgi:hypothetical protein